MDKITYLILTIIIWNFIYTIKMVLLEIEILSFIYPALL